MHVGATTETKGFQYLLVWLQYLMCTLLCSDLVGEGWRATCSQEQRPRYMYVHIQPMHVHVGVVYSECVQGLTHVHVLKFNSTSPHPRVGLSKYC